MPDVQHMEQLVFWFAASFSVPGHKKIVKKINLYSKRFFIRVRIL
jgi:hypothetical protein